MADTFTVTEQTPVTHATASGTFVPAMEIVYRTKPHDIEGRVRIPMAHYSAEHVAEVLTQQAQLLEDVHNL